MWHEARKSEKKVHDLMESARKRAMRRAVYLAERRGDPHQSLQVSGSRCRVYRDDGLYQAAEDQLGLIPWNGNEDNLIDRFDGRALLDFIREPGSRPFKVQEKSEEEEELEEFVNFERYRDLIKHRRRGFSEEEGLQHIRNELEAKNVAHLSFVKPQQQQPPPTKGSYSQVGFSYNGDGAGETTNPDTDDEDDEDDGDDGFSSDDSDDEKMEAIAKDFGVRRYNWLVYKEKKDKEEEQRQKELIKGDPSIRKLSRRERRKLSQMEREKVRELARSLGRGPHHDPYRDPRRSPSYDGYPRRRRSRSKSRSRSRSRSRSTSSYSRRHDHDNHRSSKPRQPKIEFITEFGGVSPPRAEHQKTEWISPPSSPVQSSAVLNRSSGMQILEALHGDPASASRTIEQEKTAKFVRTPASASSGLSKLNKNMTGGPSKNPVGEKKETPQERLKRIMSKQLNKQIKKDTAAEMAKKREQERERRERLAELSRLSRRSHSRSRSRSRSRDRSRNRDRSRGRSWSRSKSPPRRHRYSRSHSRSRSPRRYRARSRSPTHRRSNTRSPIRSPSPRSRSRSRH